LKLVEMACAGCGMPVPAKTQTVEAGNKKWHAKCFRCDSCKQEIPGEFAIADGKPFCVQHKPKAKTYVCTKCNQPISGNVAFCVRKPYHDACLACDGCGTPFEVVPRLKDGQMLCPDCLYKKNRG